MEPHVAELLDRRAREHPDRLALVEPGGRSVTFAALRERVAALAGGFAERGLRPGHRVVLLLPMGIRMYEALLALFWGGHVAVLVDPSAGLPRLRDALGRIGVDGLVGTRRAQLLRLVVPALRGGVLYAADGWSIPPSTGIDGISGRPLAPTAPPAGEPALVTFTTGTTGAPKAIGRSHAFLLAQHEVLAGHMGLGAGDVDLPTLPVFLLNSLAAGATCVLPDGDLRDVSRLDPARIAAQIRARGVTTTSGSPAFVGPLARWALEHGPIEELRKVFVGGARVPATLLGTLRSAFPRARIEVVYGSTEAEPIATIDAEEALATAEEEARGGGACVGRPVPGIRVRRVDPDSGRDAGAEVGEVWVAGAHVNTGYYRDAGADAENKRREGDVIWHRTGDVAREDALGRLWLVGRVGERVAGAWPFPVESRAESLPGVVRAALVEVRGGPVVAFTGEAREQDVRAATGLPARRVAEIPVDPRHRAKVDRVALAGRLEAAHGA